MSNLNLRKGLLQTLAYYDVFSYPLSYEEIVDKVRTASVPEQIQNELNLLVADGIVFSLGEFYSLQNDISLFEKRKKGNELADRLIDVAKKKAEFISGFPFIRGIFISGSLSKNYADSKSDLDFFVITSPGRLWIARSVFVLYRRFFIARKNFRYYCLNYFISSDQLTIEEQNLFTATELTTLIPVYGNYHQALINANGWLKDWLPNFKFNSQTYFDESVGFIKSLSEKFLNLFGKPADDFFMYVTLKKFSYKHKGKFSKQDFAVALKTTKKVSKVHLGHNQKRILDLYDKKIKELSHRFELAEA